MGTQIGDLLIKREMSIPELKGKTLGFDGYNIIYQFLTTIRSLDGDLLTTKDGIVTSHLIGLFHRLSNLQENEVNIVFVFDGKSLDLKKETLEKRKDLKIDAEVRAKKAEEEEDFAERNRMLKRASRITPEMIEDTKLLFDAMAIPYLTAQADGEAQLAIMNAQGKIDGVVTQDFDTLLFGGKDLYRNLAMSGKKKAPGKDYFIQIKPEYISLEENLKALQITREKLIWLGMLVGTDFNNKVPKVGPKTAIKLVTEFNSFEDILRKLEYTPDFDPDEIINLFMNPPYNPDYAIKQRDIDFEKLRYLLIERYEFNKERVEKTLTDLEKVIIEKKKQPRLSKWF